MLAIPTLLLACIGGAIAAPTPGQPAPVPSGGVGVRPNDTAPLYHTVSDFDYQSFNLALYQEWIELDLFNYIARRFSVQEFADAGLNEEDISLIQFMANQEVGHATLLSNIVSYGGRAAAEQCTYRYYFDNVREALDFTQRLTRWGESGVYGFLSHLDSRESANLLTQSIATEARQQMVMRQFSGAHPMPVYFETGISQSMAWSLLQRYIISCPQGNPMVEWSIFPGINVTNGSPLTVDGYETAITHNRTSLTEAGQEVQLTWESPRANISADGMYNSSVGPLTDGQQPAFVAWVSQLNVTYTPLNVTGNNSGVTTQPGGFVFNSTDDGIVNGTNFIGITSQDLYVTPYNLSLLNDYLFAWDIYQAN